MISCLGALICIPLKVFGGQINTEQGYYSLSASFPGPVKVGRNSMKLTVNDRKSEKPAGNKLDIEVVPWMTAHEHGSSEFPLVKKTGPGTYRVERLNFSMPGDWQVYIRIKDGSREDTAVFDVHVGR